MSIDSEDFDDRRLCPDESCIGLLGDDGRCRVCGRSEDGSVMPVLAEELGGSAEPSEDGAFDDDRELCPDGACIGVIGSDGKCKVCGRPRGS